MAAREDHAIAAGLVGGGLIAILGFVTWALVFYEIPPANENAFLLLVGILSANVGAVVGYFFGASITNKKQSETIDTLARTAQTAAAALAPDSPTTKE